MTYATALNRTLLAGVLAIAFSAPTRLAWADELANGFLSPPDLAKPRTWWHWISGNVSAEGITADLKAMKEIGLGGAQIFNVDTDRKNEGPVAFMSPQWRKLVHQTMTEAADLHLEIGMEGCQGWSESGGSWVTGAQSMQKVVWTEKTIDGGRSVSLDLPQPETKADFYQEIAVLAFPARTSDGMLDSPQITCNQANFSPRDSMFGPFLIKHTDKSSPISLQFAFADSVKVGSVDITTQALTSRTPCTLQASDDGTTFHDVTKLLREGLTSFPPATGKYFRLVYSADVDGGARVSHVQFSGSRLSNAVARAGMQPMTGLSFDAEKTPVEPGDVIDPKTLVDLTGQKQWNAPAGRWTIMRFGHTSTGAMTGPASGTSLECDKLSKTAVESHIANMYGPIWADSPQQVGSTFNTILLDSWEAKCQNWTELMPQEFKSRHGYDLAPWLPAIAGRIVGDVEQSERFLWDFRLTISDLVATNHYKTFQDAAHAHGMTLAAEAPGTGTPMITDNLLCKKYTDIPMGEFWLSNGDEGNIDDPKEAVSAAHIYGKTIVAMEAYTASPTVAAWKNDPYSLKRMGDFEFCLGVNRFVFHRYAHQPWLDRVPGMSMGAWGINFERTNTWWDKGGPWIEYLTRCQYLLQRGRPVADLLYFYGEGAPMNLSHLAVLPKIPVGSDYDVCNADVIMNEMSVENGEIVLKSGMRYRLLSLRRDRMTLPLLQKIAELVKAGATVYAQRPTKSPSLSGPADADAQIAALADEVWGKGPFIKQHAYGAGRIVYGQPVESYIGAPDFAASQPNVLFAHRTDAESEIYFVSNQLPQDRVVDCNFRVDGKVPELWHADTGRIETAAIFHQADGRTTLPLHFDPYGSLFVIFRHPADSTSLASVTRDGQALFSGQPSDAADLPQINSGNVAMQVWQAGKYTCMTASGQQQTAAVPALPPAVTIDGPWQLTFPPKRGAPASATFDQLMSYTDSTDTGIKFFSGTADYTHDFSLPAEFTGKDHRVWLDLGDVKNLAEVSLNGKSLGILWKAPFRVEITDAVQAGNNHLVVKVTNLWPNRLIGDQQLPEDKRVTWTNVNLYKADSPLLPSGLLGPVKIVPAAELTMTPGK